MQQFSLDRADAVGSSGPDVDVQVSPVVKGDGRGQAHAKAVQCGRAKKNFQLSLESQYRHHLHVTALSQQRDAREKARLKAKEEKRNALRNTFSPPKRPVAKTKDNTAEKAAESGDTNTVLEEASIQSQSSAWSSRSSGSDSSFGSESGDIFNEMVNDEEKMSRAIRKLQSRRREHVAAVALHATARESSAPGAPCRALRDLSREDSQRGSTGGGGGE